MSRRRAGGGTSSLPVPPVPRGVYRRHLLVLCGVSFAGCVDGPSDSATGGGDAETTDGGTDGGSDDATETPGEADRTDAESEGSLTLSSPAFDDGGSLPVRFTCDGEGVSPPLAVGGVPDGAETLALVVDDPDAPGDDPFVHWLLWNVAADTASIPADVPAAETVLDGARQGTNDGGDVGYYPACPPTGDGPHTYRFTLFALDDALDVAAGARRGELDDAIEAAHLAQTRLTATFERSS